MNGFLISLPIDDQRSGSVQFEPSLLIRARLLHSSCRSWISSVRTGPVDPVSLPFEKLGDRTKIGFVSMDDLNITSQLLFNFTYVDIPFESMYISGWWFGICSIFICVHILGMPSSQLIDFIFSSEGWLNHQPAILVHSFPVNFHVCNMHFFPIRIQDYLRRLVLRFHAIAHAAEW